jgi:RNA polymerase sigma-70 factor (ECF subfamily)
MGRTDQELLARLRTDPAAFEELYLRHVGKIVAAVTRRAGDPAEVRDLVAAAFTRIHESVRRYDPARSSPLPWMLGVTGQVVAERHVPVVPATHAPPWASSRRALEAAQRARLERRMRASAPARRRYQAMMRLPPRERAMVELVELDGLTHIQAAEALGVWPSLARLRLSRAERKLARSAHYHPPPEVVANAGTERGEPLDEVGPLELELLGELRTALYDPRRTARALRAARHRHHRAMAGSRRLTTAPALMLALATVLGGAFAAGQLFEPASSRGGASSGAQAPVDRRIACYEQLDQRATATATAAGESVWPPGAPALQACLSAWKRQEVQLARNGIVRHIVPQTPGYVVCQQRNGTVGVFPNPRQLSLDDACASIGASVPEDARFGGATVSQVRTFDLDLRVRLRQAGLGTGCDPYGPLLETIRASVNANGLRGWTIRDRTSAQGVDPVNGAPVFRPDGGKRWTRFSVNPLNGQVTIGTAPDGAC